MKKKAACRICLILVALCLFFTGCDLLPEKRPAPYDWQDDSEVVLPGVLRDIAPQQRDNSMFVLNLRRNGCLTARGQVVLSSPEEIKDHYLKFLSEYKGQARPRFVLRADAWADVKCLLSIFEACMENGICTVWFSALTLDGSYSCVLVPLHLIQENETKGGRMALNEREARGVIELPFIPSERKSSASENLRCAYCANGATGGEEYRIVELASHLEMTRTAEHADMPLLLRFTPGVHVQKLISVLEVCADFNVPIYFDSSLIPNKKQSDGDLKK